MEGGNMIQNIAPTKSNLLKIKEDLKLSKVGYNLIDKKRTVLIKRNDATN